MKRILGLSVPFKKSDEDAIPVYHQLSKVIQEQIENGRLAIGEQLPTERKIAELNKVSLATVRKTLGKLVQQGLINRVQGKGTYVSSTAIRREKIRYYPFVRDFKETPAKTKVKFIELNTIKGQPSVNHHLKISPSNDLIELRRIITTHHGKPLVYCISYLPQEIFEGLKNIKRIQFEKYYLYILLEKEFGISTIENVELYGAALADDHISKYLQVEVGHPLLRVDMVALTHKKKPYEYRMAYCLTDENKIRRNL